MGSVAWELWSLFSNDVCFLHCLHHVCLVARCCEHTLVITSFGSKTEKKKKKKMGEPNWFAVCSKSMQSILGKETSVPVVGWAKIFTAVIFAYCIQEPVYWVCLCCMWLQASAVKPGLWLLCTNQIVSLSRVYDWPERGIICIVKMACCVCPVCLRAFMHIHCIDIDIRVIKTSRLKTSCFEPALLIPFYFRPSCYPRRDPCAEFRAAVPDQDALTDWHVTAKQQRRNKICLLSCKFALEGW